MLCRCGWLLDVALAFWAAFSIPRHGTQHFKQCPVLCWSDVNMFCICKRHQEVCLSCKHGQCTFKISEARPVHMCNFMEAIWANANCLQMQCNSSWGLNMLAEQASAFLRQSQLPLGAPSRNPQQLLSPTVRSGTSLSKQLWTEQYGIQP